MMVEKGMQARRELSSWSSNRRQSTVGIAPVFWKLKTCPQWYNSSNNSTPSNPSQAVLQTEQQVFKHESMGAILFETTHLCITAYIGVPGPDSKSFQVQISSPVLLTDPETQNSYIRDHWDVLQRAFCVSWRICLCVFIPCVSDHHHELTFLCLQTWKYSLCSTVWLWHTLLVTKP